jgi:hypothetical protein
MSTALDGIVFIPTLHRASYILEFGMLLNLTLFKFLKKRELECVWCGRLKNFKGLQNIKGRV